MLVSADQMVALLLRSAPLDRLDHVGPYASAIESIVFELLARHVDGTRRSAARSAYQTGIAAGLYGIDTQADGETAQASREGSRADALLKMMTRAGWEHGRAIRHYIVLQRTE